MPAQILDGRALANEIKVGLKNEIQRIKEKTGAVPRLINIMLVYGHSACTYANSQKRVAEEIGIRYEMSDLPEATSQGQLCNYIRYLNEEPPVNGVMIHKPVPDHIDYRLAANVLDTAKDLEGINVTNIGKMMLGETRLIPCTPAAVMELLRSTGVRLRGREAVIVGASEIVGKPLSLLLLREYATVTVAHIATSEAGRLKGHVQRADILIVAAGRPRLIKGDWIKEGAIVIDVGINRVGDQVVGDVEFEEASKRAAFITPVPGGVGPVTVVMLMRNGIEAFKIQREWVS